MPLPPAVGDLARLRLRVAVLTLGSLRRRQRRRMRWRWRWAVNLTCKLRKMAGTAMMIVTIVVIGGIGTLEGPIIGTLLFFAVRETLADLGTIYLIVLGLVAIGAMLKAPRGVWGLIRSRFDIELFPLGFRVQPGNDKGA